MYITWTYVRTHMQHVGAHGVRYYVQFCEGSWPAASGCRVAKGAEGATGGASSRVLGLGTARKPVSNPNPTSTVPEPDWPA